MRIKTKGHKCLSKLIAEATSDFPGRFIPAPHESLLADRSVSSNKSQTVLANMRSNESFALAHEGELWMMRTAWATSWSPTRSDAAIARKLSTGGAASWLR